MAKEVASQGRIKVNGQQAKAGTLVQVGDEVSIQFGNKVLTIEVKEIKDSTKKEDAKSMYTVIKEEPLS